MKPSRSYPFVRHIYMFKRTFPFVRVVKSLDTVANREGSRPKSV